MKFHEKLKRAMEARGVWTARLIREAGLERSQSAVQEWIDGTTPPPRLEDALKVAKALGLSLDYLADDEIETPQQIGMELSPARTRILEIVEAMGEDAIRLILEYVADIGTAEARARLTLKRPLEVVGQVPETGKKMGRPRR